MYKVLLADDEPSILEGLANIISWSDYGFEISGKAINGFAALDAFKSQKADILITDVTMPKMNGLELIKSIKELEPNTKFIVLSGYNEFEYVKQGIALGIENYLLKPVNVQELADTLINTYEKLESQKFKEINEKKDKNILKDNVLYRWATNKIDTLELMERSKLLQANINHAFYTACIISITEHEREDAEINKNSVSVFNRFYDEFCRISVQSDSQLYCTNFDNEIIAIYGADSVEKCKNYITEMIGKVNIIKRHSHDMDIFITVGDFQPGFTNLHKSYNNAKKMKEFQMIYSSDMVCYYTEGQDGIKPDTLQIKIDYQHFTKLLLVKNKEDIFEFINGVFDSLKSYKNITPSYIKNCCAMMIIHIGRIFENFEYRIPDNEYGDIFSYFNEIHTIDQLCCFTKKMADKAIDSSISGDNEVCPVIKQVLNYISSHYLDELSLKKLGYEMNINPAYLGQLFQKETGHLFNDYVNIFKIQKAKQLLLDTNLRAVEISMRVGFSDPNYFFKQFKKYVGISPSELRAQKILLDS